MDSSLPTDACRPSTSLDIARRCVDAARLAPSPDNNQPWAFRVREDAIDVLHVRRRAIRSDVRDLFSWLAVGAAIENLALAASAKGFAAEVHFRQRPFDQVEQDELVATATLVEGGDRDPLADHIERRTTNRRPYRRTEVSSDQRRRLTEAVRNEPECSVSWVTGRKPIAAMGKLVATADRLRFETRSFHEELFEVLRFDPKEVERARDGLDVRTLEMPGMLMPALRMLGNWSLMSTLNRIGGSRALAGLSAKQVTASGALAMLWTLDDSDAGYLRAGRAMQRLWLAATAEGLAIQPLGSVPLFLLRLREAPDTLSPPHRAALEQLQGAVTEQFPDAGPATPVMLFRLGEAPAPSARSVRYDLDAIVTGEAA